MFESFLKELGRFEPGLHAVSVIRGGETVLRRCFHEDKRYPVYSAAKSVTAAAVLIAQSEGRLCIDDKLYTYIEDRYSSLIPEGFKELTFADFMTMCAAPYPFRPADAAKLLGREESTDWLADILSLPVDYGNRSFNYSNICAYLVSAACENAAGQPLAEYLAPRLFEPLGWHDPVYQTSPEGHFYGATGMELTLDEFSRLGQLFLQEGSFGGKQLIPRELAAEAVKPRVKTGKGGYGYFFRTFDEGFYICGKWGQLCIVCPEKQLIVTTLADLPGRGDELAPAIIGKIAQLPKIYGRRKKMKQLEIEALVENLDQALRFVDEQLEAADCPLKTQMKIDIAVEELFVNVAHYAYAPSTGSVVLGVDIPEDNSRVSITFADSGVPYDPLAKEDPDVSLPAAERQIGGLGIFMVKRTMDDMKYEYRDGKNILTITKTFS